MFAVVLAVTLVLSTVWISLISGLLIPFLVGLSTKLSASYGVKGLLTVLLSAAAGLLQNLVNGDGTITDAWILQAVLALGSATLIFFNVYSPFNVDEHLAPTKGFGSPLGD